MDKKIFLLDRDVYNESQIKSLNLTENDLEKWVMENDYNDDNSIIKVDANGYDTADDALEGELPFINTDDYIIFTFNF
jgi:hypothetical protein